MVKKAERDVYDIVAMLSHELRSGFAFAIRSLNRLHKCEGVQQNQEIAKIVKRLKYLELMTTGVLTIEVILNSGGVPHLELFDVREILDTALEHHEDNFTELQKKVDHSMGYIPMGVVLVKSHRAILGIVTNSLMENQGKYGGSILAYGYREDKTHFDVTFFGNGAGIPSWLKEKLFESTGKEFHDSPGTGYGLLGAQRLLKKIGCLLIYEEADEHPLFIIKIPKEI